MGLADEIADGHELLYRRSHTAVCTMARILGYLNDDDREALERLLGDRRVFGTSIADLLNGWAPKISAAVEAGEFKGTEREDQQHLAQLCAGISDGSVQRHRRGKCQCGDD